MGTRVSKGDSGAGQPKSSLEPVRDLGCQAEGFVLYAAGQSGR